MQWIEPKPDHLDAISPSAVTTFEGCAKRLAYRRDPKTKVWIKRSTRTILGVVSHALTEEVLLGASPSGCERREWLMGRWDYLLQEQVKILQHEWPGRLIPLVETWRGYVATRTRLLLRLETTSEARSKAPGLTRGRELPELPWVELRLSDARLGLFGTPDLVEIQGDELRVVDLKSGVHQRSITDSQERQLRLYSHLVQANYGRYADVLVIQDSRGREKYLDASKESIALAVGQAVRAMDSFNSMAESGTFPASASSQLCSICEFQVVCHSYWESNRSDWSPVGACGQVTSLDGVVAVLEMPRGIEPIITRVIPCDGVNFTVGEVVAISNLERAGNATGRMKWNSRLRRSPG